jgi:hypothetical protein
VLHIGHSEAEGAVLWGHGIDEQYVCMVYMQVQQARGCSEGQTSTMPTIGLDACLTA